MPQSELLGLRVDGFPRGDAVEISLDGRPIRAFTNETVAVALLAEGVSIFSRSIKFHRPRSAFCLSGDCGACLMRIDGQPNVRACRTVARPGLRCERQNAWPSADLDVLATADLMFPEGMDHHTLMTSPRPLNQVMQRVVQQLGGLGRLPAAPPSTTPGPAIERHVAAVVIGGGPAGLAAARALAAGLMRRARGPRDVVLIEAAPEPGGSYLAHPELGIGAAAPARDAAKAAGVEILSDTAAIGYYPEETTAAAPAGHHGLLVAASPTRLYKLSSERFVYATGGHPRNALFFDNDRPGVMPARAVGLLLGRYGVALGQRPLIVGDDAYADALARAFERTGAEVRRIDGRSERVHRALGEDRVTGAEIAEARAGDERAQDAATRRIECDLIAISLPPAPASALPQLHGTAVAWDPRCGFVVTTDASGRTSAPAVWACGELTGPMTPAEAAAHGERVGSAALAE